MENRRRKWDDDSHEITQLKGGEPKNNTKELLGNESEGAIGKKRKKVVEVEGVSASINIKSFFLNQEIRGLKTTRK